jgi:uncharacterized membrane protein YiaA
MLRKIIPHICISLSLVTITFLILGQFNPILGKSFVQIVILILSLSSLITSAYLIGYNRRVHHKRQQASQRNERR